MKQFRIALLAFVCALCGVAVSPSILAQHGSVTVDWKAELAKAKSGIEKNPESGFWHNQAGVAYDALGDFQNAVKELKLASTLDPSNPIDDYALYAIYKRRAMHPEQREVLLDALEKDPNNPVGRFEFAFILEKEKHWADSLRQYQTAKILVATVTGPVYVDPRGNAYDVDGVRGEADKAIDRVAKLNESAPPIVDSAAGNPPQATGQESLSAITAPTNWHKVDAGPFSILAPSGWEFHQLEGVDSYVGEFVGDGVVLRFDYGGYSNPLKEEKKPACVIVHKSIAGLRAKIVRPRTPGHGVTGVYFHNVGDSNALSLFGHNLTSTHQELALKIFETIRFGGPPPRYVLPPPPAKDVQ